MKRFFILFSVCSFSFGHERMNVKEGDSVTLHTGVTKKEDDRIRWYFNDILIAQINGDLSKICTDVQCNDGNERFRGRLKLDHQTGSLIITNTRTTDSGDYQLLITNGNSDSEKIFSVSIHAVSAAEMKRKSVKEGESVTLDTGVKKTTNNVMMWYFNNTFIAEISGNQSKICTDNQCDERFRDRLKVDHQTGSLTITNTRTTDSGLYKLSRQITSNNSRRYRRSSNKNVKSFEVTVIDSGRSQTAAAGIYGVVLLMFATVVGVIYSHCRISRKDMEKNKQEPLRKTYSETKMHDMREEQFQME